MRFQKRHSRKAFTLIELVIVITILVVIASLTIGAIGKSYTWIRQKNTEQTMTKVILRLQKVIDRLYKEVDDWPSSTEGFILDQANGSFERAKVLKFLYLCKWNFPNSYAEAYHNVQESRQLYDNRIINPGNLADHNNYPGYPTARSLLNKLRSKNPSIPDPFNPVGPAYIPYPHNLPGPVNYRPWAAGTIPNNLMATELPRQSSACMLAAFTSANGTVDEFTNEDVTVGSGTDTNPYITDSWGTPLFFLRHGNFAYSKHRFGGGAVPRPAHTVGMVRPAGIAVLDFAPLEYVFNKFDPVPVLNQQPPAPAEQVYQGYFGRLQLRANQAYSNLNGRDAYDPTGLLKNNNNWRTSAASGGDWMDPAFATWMAPPLNNQHGLWFRSTFGYSPEPTNQVVNGVPLQNQAYTPMVIISAGGDKIFYEWGDNLDSYRLQINVSGQQ
jgi:prepilin-type N-terminal cleavage/methylation domain-containing protein